MAPTVSSVASVKPERPSDQLSKGTTRSTLKAVKLFAVTSTVQGMTLCVGMCKSSLLSECRY